MNESPPTPTSASTPAPTSPTPDQRDSVSLTVARRVADAEGVSPIDLEPIGNVVDPDALNGLFDGVSPSPDGPRGTVEFTYEGYGVTVRADGHVEVSECDA